MHVEPPLCRRDRQEPLGVVDGQLAGDEPGQQRVAQLHQDALLVEVEALTDHVAGVLQAAEDLLGLQVG